MNTSFSKVKKRLLYEGIALEVLRSINDGVYRAGDRLPSERDMADQMGVNRTTLREVLRLLEFMRVLDKRMGDGVYISTNKPGMGIEAVMFRLMFEDGLDTESLVSMHETLVKIEGVIAELASQRLTAEEMVVLKNLSAELIQAVDSLDLFTELDRKFYQTIHIGCKSPVFLGVINSIWAVTGRYALLLYGPEENRRKCIENNQKLLNSLERHLSGQSKRLAEEHFFWAGRKLFEMAGI